MFKKPRKGRRRSHLADVPQYRTTRTTPSQIIGAPPKIGVPKTPPLPPGAKLPPEVEQKFKKRK